LHRSRRWHMAFDWLVGADPNEKIWTHAVQIIVPSAMLCYAISLEWMGRGKRE
jgi:hypothetical protein